MTPAFVPSPAETRARASLSARLWRCARRAEGSPCGSLVSLPANDEWLVTALSGRCTGDRRMRRIGSVGVSSRRWMTSCCSFAIEIGSFRTHQRYTQLMLLVPGAAGRRARKVAVGMLFRRSPPTICTNSWRPNQAGCIVPTKGCYGSCITLPWTRISSAGPAPIRRRYR